MYEYRFHIMSQELINAAGKGERHNEITPVARFDRLMRGLKPMQEQPVKIHGRDILMGGRNTPVINIRDEKIMFSTFRPRNKKPHPYYSQSILLQSLEFRQRGEVSYPAPKKQIRLRRDLLIGETGTGELDEIEKFYDKFIDAAYKLHPTEAQSLGFSNNFVRRLKIRRAGRTLARFLRIAED